jgi:geranylgeranyl pyrophosphate synthase
MGETLMSKEQSLKLEDVYKSSKGDLDRKIADMISDKKMSSILEGGKGLRSLLAFLSFKACTQGNETPIQYQKALEGAVVIELAHAASLVHDDIIDNDSERRGRPAFHIKEGISKAILMGHKMLATGFNITLKHGKDVAKLYIESWNQVVNGELDEVTFNRKDMKTLKNTPTKSKIFEAYNKIIDLKTAVLFSSACKAGAIEADMTGDILKVFADYGREIGLAYQLADDLVDLANGEMIDSVIIPLLNRLGQKIKVGATREREIKKEFAKNKDKIEEFYICEIKKHIRKAEELGNSEIIPYSPYKGLLTDAPTYIINRMLKQINVTI